MRNPVAVAALGAVLCAACSPSTDPDAEGTGAAPSTPAPVLSTSAAALPGATSTRSPSGALPGAAVPTPAVQRPVPAGAWRLVVRSPRSHSQVSSPFPLSYEITGPTRSGELVLEVTLEDPVGEGPDAAPRRFAVEAGRGSVTVEVGKLSTGRHDVRVRLLAAGSALRDVVLQDLRIAGDRSAG